MLPVTDNPITNAATAADPGDRLGARREQRRLGHRPATSPTTSRSPSATAGATELSGFEVFYTFTDPTDSLTESYYFALPTDFTIAPGETRVAHFDGTGARDHFPENAYSLYHTSLNAMDVTVEVSAEGAAIQTATVQKDPGGDENPDE